MMGAVAGDYHASIMSASPCRAAFLPARSAGSRRRRLLDIVAALQSRPCAVCRNSWQQLSAPKNDRMPAAIYLRRKSSPTPSAGLTSRVRLYQPCAAAAASSRTRQRVALQFVTSAVRTRTSFMSLALFCGIDDKEIFHDIMHEFIAVIECHARRFAASRRDSSQGKIMQLGLNSSNS